jgi:hypothetical protein
MGIQIYTDANSGAFISTADSFSKPMLVAMNGRTGGVIQKRIYIRNSDITKYYTAITLKPFSATVTLYNGSVGLSWKLSAGDTKPTDEGWALIAHGNTISLPNLVSGDITTYLPLWVRIEIPRSTDVQTIKDVKLQIVATETLA